jgi:hypothetical protein
LGPAYFGDGEDAGGHGGDGGKRIEVRGMMHQLNILKTRFRALLGREAVIRDIDEEMRFHVEMETQANLERGMRPEEARAKALGSFGNPGRMRALAYEIRGGGAVEKLWRRLKDGGWGRSWNELPCICVAALVMAIEIGPCLMVFGVNYSVFRSGTERRIERFSVALRSHPRDTRLNCSDSIEGWDRAGLNLSSRDCEEPGRQCPSLAPSALWCKGLAGLRRPWWW